MFQLKPSSIGAKFQENAILEVQVEPWQQKIFGSSSLEKKAYNWSLKTQNGVIEEVLESQVHDLQLLCFDLHLIQSRRSFKMSSKDAVLQLQHQQQQQFYCLLLFWRKNS